MPATVWVGLMTNEGESFFDTEKMQQIGKELKGDMEAYQWAVTDAGELQEVNGPVPEEYA